MAKLKDVSGLLAAWHLEATKHAVERAALEIDRTVERGDAPKLSDTISWIQKFEVLVDAEMEKEIKLVARHGLSRIADISSAANHLSYVIRNPEKATRERLASEATADGAPDLDAEETAASLAKCRPKRISVVKGGTGQRPCSR